MIRSTSMLSLMVLAASFTVCAQDSVPDIPHQVSDRHQWRTVDASMTNEEYEAAYRRNIRLVGKSLESSSKDALTSAGIPEVGINVVSAAVGLAVQDKRFNLNRSKTLALEFKDAANEDRSLFLGVNFNW